MKEYKVISLKSLAFCMILVLLIPALCSGLSSFENLFGLEMTWKNTYDPAEEEREEERSSEKESHETSLDEFSIPGYALGLSMLTSTWKGRSSYLASTITFVCSIPYPPPEETNG